MFSYLSSWFSSGGNNNNQKVTLEGTLIEQPNSKTNPFVKFMHCKATIDRSTTQNFETLLIIESIPSEYKNEDDEEQANIDTLEFILDETRQFSTYKQLGANNQEDEDAEEEDTIDAFVWRDERIAARIYVFKLSEKFKQQQNKWKDFYQLAGQSILENSLQRKLNKEDLEEYKLENIIGTFDLKFDIETLEREEEDVKVVATPVKNRMVPSANVGAKNTTNVGAKSNLQKEEKKEIETIYPSLYLNTNTSLSVTNSKENNLLCEAKGDLYLFNTDSKIYELKKNKIIAEIYQIEDEEGNLNFEYEMIVKEVNNNNILIQQQISSEMNLQMYQEFHSITWDFILKEKDLQKLLQNTVDKNIPKVSNWSIIFLNRKEEEEFKITLSRCIYESNTEELFSKLKIEDQEMLVKANTLDCPIDNKMEIDSKNEEEDEEEEKRRFLRELAYNEDEDYVDFIYDSEDDEDSEEEEEVVRKKQTKSSIRVERPKEKASSSSSSNAIASKYTNSLMLDSSTRDRTFVVRGNSVGVFKHDEDDYKSNRLKYDTQINNLEINKEVFVPYKGMLHNQDNNILFLHEDQDEDETIGKVFRLDLNRGQIVETWDACQNLVPIDEIRPIEKYAEQTTTQVFGALNSNTIFAMDPRIQTKDKIVVGNINDITARSNPQYSCFATNMDGRLVVGSDKGEIRLYSGIPNLPKGEEGNKKKNAKHPKTAKTLLPGFGDPIVGLDVTADGKWIVATCKNYLLVIKTVMPSEDDEDEEEITGFTERMGKHKPTPRKIQLLPEDIKKVGGKVSFTPAKFNTGKDGEMWICSSTGPYLITWNFKRIQNNQLFDYTMKQVGSDSDKAEEIVMDQFKSVRMNEEGRNAPILVTTPNDVLIERKVKVKKNPYHSRRTRYSK